MGRFVPSMAARSVVAAVLLACAIALAFDGSLDETTDLGETHEVANIGADDTLSIMLRNEQEDEESDDDELGETKATVGRALKDAGETNDAEKCTCLDGAVLALVQEQNSHESQEQPQGDEPTKDENKEQPQGDKPTKDEPSEDETKSSHKATNQPRMRTK